MTDASEASPTGGDLLSELERQTRLNRALFEVSQRLAAINASDEVAPALARAMRDATGASYALVGAWRPEINRVEFLATDGLSDAQRQQLAAVEMSPERFRLIRGGLEGRANVRVAPFDPQDLPIEVADILEVTAIAGAPVVVDGRAWGVVAVATRAGDPSIVETGVELLSGLTSIAASAIGRTEAVAALGHQAEVLETLVAERTRQLTRAVEDAHQASTAKSALLANISHELRTPLTAILGYSQVLRSQFDGTLNEAQMADVVAIEDGGRRLLELVDDLLTATTIERGRVDIHVEAIELEPFLADIVESFRRAAGEREIDLRFAPDPGLPAGVNADRRHLREILVNLVRNGLTYTAAGGRVEVTGRVEPRQDVTDPARPDQLVIAVSDTGIGIAADDQELVFEQFARVAGPAYPGAGLGLAIARDLARLHGGDITLESAPGQGSQFTLALPVEAQPATAASGEGG
jgi:signal transduction histidine kinase